MVLDHRRYPHIFDRIVQNTSIDTYIGLRLLNKKMGNRVGNGFGTFISSERQVDVESPLPVYEMQLRDGAGYYIATCRTRITDGQPPTYALDEHGNDVLSDEVVDSITLLTRFIRRNCRGVDCHIIGDCLGKHNLFPAMIRVSKQASLPYIDIFSSFRIIPDRNGEIAVRVPDGFPEPSFQDNWRAEPRTVTYPTGENITYHITGSERNRLYSSCISEAKDVELDFRDWSRAKTNSGWDSESPPHQHNPFVDSLIELASDAIAKGKKFRLFGIPGKEVLHWLGIYRDTTSLSPPELPWSNVTRGIAEAVREKAGEQISFVLEYVSINFSPGGYEFVWKSLDPKTYIADDRRWDLRKVYREMFALIDHLSFKPHYYGCIITRRYVRVADGHCIWTSPEIDLSIESTLSDDEMEAE